MKKRLLSLALCLVLCLGLFPFGVLAEEANNDDGYCKWCNAGPFVASVDGTYYNTLEEALDNANGGTVTLLADVTDAATISTALTLDLNGHSVSDLTAIAAAKVKDSGKTKGTIGELTVTGGKLADLLEEGYAFNNSTSGIQDGYTNSTLSDVTIVSHTHHAWTENGDQSSCACGLTCDHDDWDHNTGKCTLCEKQLYQARIGDTGYQYLRRAIFSDTAINSTSKDTVIYVLTDIDLGTGSFDDIKNGTFTIDLGGHTLTAKNGSTGVFKFSNEPWCSANITVQNGTVKSQSFCAFYMYAGNVTLDNVTAVGTTKHAISMSDGSIDVKNSIIYGINKDNDGTIQLHEGTKILPLINWNDTINLPRNAKINDLLADGCAFAALDSDSEGAIVNGSVNHTTQSFIVVSHQHTFNTSGMCACGVQAVASVREAYYTDVSEAISKATDGDTVKLLADVDTVTINKTGVKLDANGKTIGKLTVSGGATLSGLLPEGYAYKNNSSGWISEPSGSELTNVTMAKAPIRSLSIAADNTSVTYGRPITVTATAIFPDTTKEVSYKWYCTDNPNITSTPDVGASWTLDTLNAGTYTFTCKATCDGYTVTSSDVTVTVGKAAGSIANKAESGYAAAYTYGQKIPTPVKDNFTTNSEGNLTYTWDKTPENAGSYLLTVTVAEDDNHTAATLKIPVTINPKIVKNPSITVAAGSVYDGTEQKPAVTVKDGDTVIDPSEYTVSYDNNINAGSEATVILTDKEGGNYTVSGRTTFSIAKATLDGVSVKQSKALTYNSKAQTAKVTTTAAARGGQAVTFTYSTEETGTYGELPAFPGAGTYTLYYKASAANHETASGSFQVVIGQAPVTVRASDKSAYVGSTAPDLSKPELGKDYTISGLFGEDTLKTAPKLSYVLTPDMSKVGSAEIKIEGAEVGANYKLDYQNGKLNITTRPSSGGSGSTGTKTDTVKNPDGSTTKTETKSDGSRTETTTATTPGGSTGSTVTKTDANGSSRTEASAKLSDQDVKNAQETGGAVTVPVQGIEAAKDASTATEVTIDLPKTAGKTTVGIPVEGVTSGTVAVIVHADGTEEIAKSSKPTEDGVQLEIDGSTTVKIIDNSKDFIDTRNHWSRDEVNFVAARGLFNGVGNNLFGVSLPMTRGMVNTVLARLSGVDTNGGSTWYEKGTEWAMKNGITDGTNPTGNVTREQLATLLYRYAGSPDVSGTLSFADNASISDYARNALLWANQKGIMSGVGNNTIAPKANAQRAQVAAMFARYLKNL